MRLGSIAFAAMLLLGGPAGALAQSLSSDTNAFGMMGSTWQGDRWTQASQLPLSSTQLSPAQVAANCQQCHSADGVLQQFLRGTGESHMAPLPLAGMTESQIIARVDAFRLDESRTSAMHRIARKFDQQQIRELAAYLARETTLR